MRNLGIIDGKEIMTDKQFDSIIEMVIQILNRSTDLDDAKSALLSIKHGGSYKEMPQE